MTGKSGAREGVANMRARAKAKRREPEARRCEVCACLFAPFYVQSRSRTCSDECAQELVRRRKAGS